MANVQAQNIGKAMDSHRPSSDSAGHYAKKPTGGKSSSDVTRDSQEIDTTNEQDGEDGDSSVSKEKADASNEPDRHASSGAVEERLTRHIISGDTSTSKVSSIQQGDPMDLDPIGSKVPSVATSDFGDDDALIQQRMAELEAMGWRPEEEAGEIPDDDDDYNGVDAISESDEGDARTRQEEDMMLSSQNLNADEEEALVRRLSLSSAGSDFAAFGISSSYLFAESPFLQSQFMFDELESDNVFGGTTPLARKNSEESNDGGRRVRFEDEMDHSDAESVDSEQVESFFPDLFVQQDHLDPNFRRVIENDQDLYLDDASDTGSYWDYDGDELRVLMMDNESSGSDSDLSAGSSGYESDDGDTTEEEQESMPPPPAPDKVEKKPASPVAAGSAISTPKVAKSRVQSQSRRPAPRGPRMPKMGTFIIDPDKPVLTIDGTGRNARHILWPARNQTPDERAKWNQMCSLNNTRNNSPRGSVQLTPAEESDSSNQFASLDMAPAFLDYLNNRDVVQAIAPQGTIAAPSGGDSFTVSNDEEDPLDFLNFEDEDDQDDDDMPEEADALFTSPTASTPFPHYKAKGSVHDDLLAHFDRLGGAVGSFRRNQQFARHVGSLPAHPALRNATSESNAMQTGRRAAANTPITPLRRKRMGKDVGHRNPPMSPLSKSPVNRRNRNRSHSLRH